ncbi:rhomboid family intramembrane serine protease [soil metagenome]
MIFPIGDDNSDRTTTPIVTYALITINILVFVFLQGLGANEQFTYAFSTVPQGVVTGEDIARPVVIEAAGQRAQIPLQPTPGSVYLTLLTSMFMHGSIMHIFGNMLYLWIFGDNIEHAFGRVRYLIFYLVTGLIASLAHVFSTVMFGGNSYIPSLGASGAISGVLGGYLLLFPRRQVKVIMLRMLTTVPAIVAIGIWFLFQLLEGYLTRGPEVGGGVAYAAHIGGFIAGLALVKFFAIGRTAQKQ